jgi:hypothetical protein
VEHAPELYLLEAIAQTLHLPGANALAKPTETQMTDVFLNVLGFQGSPVCAR